MTAKGFRSGAFWGKNEPSRLAQVTRESFARAAESTERLSRAVHAGVEAFRRFQTALVAANPRLGRALRGIRKQNRRLAYHRKHPRSSPRRFNGRLRRERK